MVYTGGTNIYVFLAQFLSNISVRTFLKTKGHNFVTRLQTAFTRRHIFGFAQKTSPLFLFRSLVWQYRDIIKDYCLLKAVYMFLWLLLRNTDRSDSLTSLFRGTCFGIYGAAWSCRDRFVSLPRIR